MPARTSLPILRTIACAWLAATSLGATASGVVESVNGDGAPPFLAFANANIGWLYTPTSSFALDGLFSTFRNVGTPTQQGPVVPRTVNLTVRENGPGGALLAQTSFVADSVGGNLGGRFAPVLLVAGRKYFIAYDNVFNIGLNIPNWMPAQNPGTVNLEGWYTGTGYATHYPKFIDGVLQVFSAPILRFEGNRVTSLAAADCLFNWAERNHPQLFAPAAGASSVLETYYYRHYPGTNAYVGLSVTDHNVYYLGPDRVLTNVGPLAPWLLASGCPAS